MCSDSRWFVPAHTLLRRNHQHFYCKADLLARSLCDTNTVELHLPGLTGTASLPDMQNIRIVGFLFENGPHWLFEVEKKIMQTTILGCLFIYVQIKH